MCHSLIGADGGTHGRIVATALAAAASVAAFGLAAWKGDIASATLARAEIPVFEAAAPARSAAADLSLIR